MERLDQYLIRVEELPSREFSREEILNGLVLVNGKKVIKPGYKVKAQDQINYLGQGRQYVSRGAYKLLGAIKSFAPTIQGMRCIDVGASTGGFTQVLLEAGAEFIAALDVGHGQLHREIESQARVKSFEGVNFRSLDKNLAQELRGFDLLTMDVSFISVLLLKDSIKNVLKPAGEAIILIKPQFEAGRGALNKAGVVTNPKHHQQVLLNVISEYLKDGFDLAGLTYSSIQGPDGNIEYLAYLKKAVQSTPTKETELLDTQMESSSDEPGISSQEQILLLDDASLFEPELTLEQGDQPATNSAIETAKPLDEEIKANIIRVVEEAFNKYELPHHR